MLRRREFLQTSAAAVVAAAVPSVALPSATSAVSPLGSAAAAAPLYDALAKVRSYNWLSRFDSIFREPIGGVDWSFATDGRVVLAVREARWSEGNTDPFRQAYWRDSAAAVIRGDDVDPTSRPKRCSLPKLKEFLSPWLVRIPCPHCTVTPPGEGEECFNCTDGSVEAEERAVSLAGVTVNGNVLANVLRDLPGEFATIDRRLYQSDRRERRIVEPRCLLRCLLRVAAPDWVLVIAEFEPSNDDERAAVVVYEEARSA
jgi:hypothetical protein